MAVSLGTVSVKLVADASDFTKGVSKGEAALKSFGKALATAGAAAAAAAAAVGVASVKAFQDFEQALANAGAKTDATPAQMEALAQAAKKMGRTTIFSAREAAEGLNILAQAGLSVGEQIEALPNVLQLAVAGNVELARASEIALGSLKGFGLGVAELGRVNDVLAKGANSAKQTVNELGEALSFAAPVAAGMGVNVEEAAAAISVLANANIKASRGGTAFNGILARMEKVSNKLGAGLNAASISQDGFALSLQKLVDKGLGAGNAMELFGLRAGPAVQSFLRQGISAIDEMTEKLEKAGGTAKRIADRQLDTFNGSVTILKSAIEGLAIEIGESMAPMLRHLADELQKTVGNIIENDKAFVEFRKGIKSGVMVIAETLHTFGPVVHGVAVVFGALLDVGNAFMIVANGISLSIGFLSFGFKGLKAAMQGDTAAWNENLKGKKRLEAIAKETSERLENLTKNTRDAHDAGEKASVAFQNFAFVLADSAQKIDTNTKAVDDNLKKWFEWDEGLHGPAGQMDDLELAINGFDPNGGGLGKSLDAINKKAEKAKKSIQSLNEMMAIAQTEALAGGFDEAAFLFTFATKQGVTQDFAPETVPDFVPSRPPTDSGFEGDFIRSDAELQDFVARQRAKMQGPTAGEGLAATLAGFDALTGATGALTATFSDMFTSSEGFLTIMDKVNGILDQVFGVLIRGWMEDVAILLSPILDMLDAIAPALRIVWEFLSPFNLAFRGLAGLFGKAKGVFDRFLGKVKEASRGLRQFFLDLFKKKGSGADKVVLTDVTDEQVSASRADRQAHSIMDAIGAVIEQAEETKEAAEEFETSLRVAARASTDEFTFSINTSRRALDTLGNAGQRYADIIRKQEEIVRDANDAVGEFQQKMLDSTQFMGDFSRHLENLARGRGLTFESEQDEQSGLFRMPQRRRSRLAEMLDDANNGFFDFVESMRGASDAADDLASSLLNAPEVFDANLRRFQAASGNGGTMTLQPTGTAGGGGAFMPITLINPRFSTDNVGAFERQLERIAMRRHGTPMPSDGGSRFNIADIRRI